MTMINRVLCRMPQSKSDLLDSMVTWPDNKPSDWHYLAVQEATNSHDFNRKGEVGESWTKLTSVPRLEAVSVKKLKRYTGNLVQ